MNGSPLGDVWEGVKSKFHQDLSPDAEQILRRMFFTGASAALALHGGIDLAAQELVRKSLQTLEEGIAAVLDAKEE